MKNEKAKVKKVDRAPTPKYPATLMDRLARILEEINRDERTYLEKGKEIMAAMEAREADMDLEEFISWFNGDGEDE